MNFLAHLWLADRTATSPAGAVLGDVVRGSRLEAFPPAIAHGIRLHRRIDAATDRDPRIAALRAGFGSGARRYAGIVLDLACDHALARDWPQHSAEPLADFCARSARAVAAQAAWFAHAGARPPQAAAFAELLRSYGEPAGIEQAFVRVAARMRRPEALLAAADGWMQQAEAVRPLLGALLADLVALALPQLPQADEAGAR